MQPEGALPLVQLVLVLEKTISPDKNELEQAQKYLENAAAVDFAMFIKMLSDVLVYGGNSQVARMAAGLQLKNHLTSKDSTLNTQYSERWLSFPPEIRSYIKKNILTAIGTESCRPSSAAQCVAHVAAVELPVGEWKNLISQLVENVVNAQSSELKKEVSLEAIGYICQDLDPEVLVEQSNQILTAIIHGMRSSEPSTHVRIAATTALLNSLDFTKANFDKENERNFIMEVVCEATQSHDTRIGVAALQCLVKILSLYYHYMEPYMPSALFPITLEAMKSDVDEISLQGIEFWSSVCEEESDLAGYGDPLDEMDEETMIIRQSRHYASGALQFIIPVLLLKLTQQEDADDWNPAKASAVCLILLSNCCSNDILGHVLPFIDEHIKSENWRFRDATLTAFGSILGGLKVETLMPLIDQAMPIVIERMYDSTPMIRDTASWTLNRIADTCPEAALNEKYFKPLMECLLTSCSAEPPVVSNVCYVFASLADAAFLTAKCHDNYPDTSVMSPYFNMIAQQLMVNADRHDASQSNLRTAAYEALMSMIKNAPNDCYATVQQITMVVLDKLEKVLQMDAHISNADRTQFHDVQSLLCATLQTILKRITKEDVPKIADAVMNALLGMFASSSGKEGGIQEDAIMTGGYLADALGEGFIKYMDVFKNYLIMGLKSHNNHKVCAAAIGVITDICRGLKNHVLPYCDEIMAILLENLRDNTIDQSIKPVIFSAFGDIAMAIGPEFHKYLDIVMKMLLQASQVPMEYADIDVRNHLLKLRESILESYTGILMGFKGEDRQPGPEIAMLEPYVPEIITYMVATAEEPYHTDNQTVLLAGLVGDLCVTFGALAVQMLEVQPINKILHFGKQSEQSRVKTTVSWASKEMRDVKKAMSQGIVS